MGSINKIKIWVGGEYYTSRILLVFTVLILSGAVGPTNVNAQSFSEWFRQRSTQKKYLLQQIAALQVYAKYYRAGNDIAHHGLKSINGSLLSENGLHNAYYNDLRTVNPVVKNNKQVNEIIQWQSDIIGRMAGLDKSANLSNEEKKYVIQVKTVLLKDCNEQMTELQDVFADDKFNISDEERLKRIGVIHTAMQDNYSFASTFSDQVKVYTAQRRREHNDVMTEIKVYGIQ